MFVVPLLEAWDTGYSDLTHLPALQAQAHCHLKESEQGGDLLYIYLPTAIGLMPGGSVYIK
jgi:hypothetical protein